MVGELRDLLLSHPCRYDTEEQIDAELFGAKLRRLERAALQEPNGDLRKELLALHGRAEPLKYERDHLAHGALWADADFMPFRTRKADHDDRPPGEIRQLAAAFANLGDDMGTLAARLRSTYNTR